MSIKKEDLHMLIDLVNEKDRSLVYHLLRVVIEKECGKETIVEADNSPLTNNEKKILRQAEMDMEKDDLIDWEDLNG